MANSLTFPVKTSFTLSWTLADADEDPINNATVTATLYAGRSLRDPSGVPGTPVAPIVGLVLGYVASSSGVYSVVVPGTLDPALDGVGYVLTVDATVGGNPIYHAEQPVVVQTAGDSIDLTTVEAVKDRAEVSSDTDDAEIQAAITGFSRYLLNLAGVGSLNSLVSYDEYYNGNGNRQMFVRNPPIQKLTAVVVGLQTIPLSGSPAVWGAVVSPDRRSIFLRDGVGGGGVPYTRGERFSCGPRFTRGVQNVRLAYDGGYPDTPEDLEYAVRCVVAINYKRKGWQDQASRATSTQGGSATTSYRNWKWPPEYDAIFEYYTRKAIIG